MAEDSTSTRRASTGVCWYTFFLLVISGEGEWRFPPTPTQKKEKEEKIRTNKNTFFLPFPSQKSADLARVRDNQRRSRARRKEYLQELETKYWTCEQVGVGASAEIQAAARLVVNENKRLRALLMKYGISSWEINGEGEETASSVVENLEAMMGKRRACGSGGTGGKADVMAAESCEQSLVAIRYGHSQMPDRGLRQLQMKGTIPSPQSSGNGLRENGGSLAGNTGVLQQQQQQQQQHSEAHQQQQQQHQQQFAALTHPQPPQAPLPPQQNHTPMQSNTHTYATTSASASSSSTSSISNPEQIYAPTSTYSPGSSSSLYGGNNNNNNPDYCYTQQQHHQQQNHQHNDFFAHNNLDIYSAVVPVPQHQQNQQQNQQQQNQYQQQPNTSASCRDIANAIRCIRPSLTLQELDEEMGCHQLCDADGGGGGGSYSGNGGNGGGIGDCKVPHYKAFELMDRLSN